MTRTKGPIRIVGDIAFVPLTQGMEALIHASDVNLVSGYSWSANRTRWKYYAGTKIRAVGSARKNRSMHSLIMGVRPGFQIDHINGNGLDNRRCNLRFATASENQRNRGPQQNNRSGYKGVSPYPKGLGWRADIWLDGVSRYLGSFRTAAEANAAYCEAAKTLHGDFAGASVGARDFLDDGEA